MAFCPFDIELECIDTLKAVLRDEAVQRAGGNGDLLAAAPHAPAGTNGCRTDVVAVDGKLEQAVTFGDGHLRNADVEAIQDDVVAQSPRRDRVRLDSENLRIGTSHPGNKQRIDADIGAQIDEGIAWV